MTSSVVAIALVGSREMLKSVSLFLYPHYALALPVLTLAVKDHEI